MLCFLTFNKYCIHDCHEWTTKISCQGKEHFVPIDIMKCTPAWPVTATSVFIKHVWMSTLDTEAAVVKTAVEGEIAAPVYTVSSTRSRNTCRSSWLSFKIPNNPPIFRCHHLRQRDTMGDVLRYAEPQKFRMRYIQEHPRRLLMSRSETPRRDSAIRETCRTTHESPGIKRQVGR